MVGGDGAAAVRLAGGSVAQRRRCSDVKCVRWACSIKDRKRTALKPVETSGWALIDHPFHLEFFF
jgi:hypothetical protein